MRIYDVPLSVPREFRPQAAELTFEFGYEMMKRLMDEVQKELDTLPP